MAPAERAGRVLAIGIDSAEPTLVRRLMAEGDMPALAGLAARGRWARVESSASIGSGSVWPTFLTGTPPSVHGIYGEWLWDPAAMTVRRYDASHLPSFLSPLAARGHRLGLLDVPFGPALELTDGFHLSEWGPHDVLNGEMRVTPEAVAQRVRQLAPHPFAGSQEGLGLDEVAKRSLRGIGQRGELAADLLTATGPDLSVIVFTEIHHASHVLWHTSEAPQSPVVELYKAVDRETGRLLAAAAAGDDDASVVVFSLHGMRPSRGLPTLLSGLVRRDGHAAPATWRTQSWQERGLSAFGAVKRHSPAWARTLYKRRVGPATRVTLAQPTMLEPLDWSRTRMFSLPTDQHGWLRVNLQGRERLGTVPPADYESLCNDVEGRLRTLTTTPGAPQVLDVLRTAPDGAAALSNPLPDLIVHWAPGASDDATALSTVDRTGQHADDGFCIAAGPVADSLDESVKSEDLHALLVPGRYEP